VVRDGTEIVTDEGKLYLDRVLDIASRRIIGFAMSEHHDTETAYGALAMAVAVRGGKETVAGVILHTDQGSEGGFNWSSQHLNRRGGVLGVADDEPKGWGWQASAVGGRPSIASVDAVAGAA
jgi:hypothetical protein